MAAIDWSECSEVEAVPGKLSGAWVLKGSRMPVNIIFDNLQAGANVNDIVQWFDGVDKRQVEHVIHFVASSLQPPAVSQ